MRLHIGTDTLQKPSDVYKGDGRMKIRKMIQFILFTAVIFSLTGCGKSYEKKIEEKYGIEIEGADNDTLKIIDEYFSKLPKGFVEELKKYEGIDNRKIFIKISDEHNENVDFYSDIGKGDYWTIGNGQYMDMGLGCCTMYSIKCNVETRKNTNNFLYVNNYCIAVKEKGDDIVFLRKIVKGGADKSYGIQVAKLAGVPDSVIERAKELVQELSDADITETVSEIAQEKKSKEQSSRSTTR